MSTETTPATPRIVDAPPELASLFADWQTTGDAYDLIHALRGHRGTRFLVGDQLFWLAKLSDRRDEVIRCCDRAMPLMRKDQR